MRVTAELTFPQTLKNHPVFYEMAKKFEIIPTIIEASFSSSMGWAYVRFEGEEDELNRLFEYLQTLDVIVDRRD